jgi:hypothetical protein
LDVGGVLPFIFLEEGGVLPFIFLDFSSQNPEGGLGDLLDQWAAVTSCWTQQFWSTRSDRKKTSSQPSERSGASGSLSFGKVYQQPEEDAGHTIEIWSRSFR